MSRHLFIRTQSKTDPFRFYVYAYLRANNSDSGKAGTPYYIGKGCGNRAFGKHTNNTIPKDFELIVILETNLTEIDAFALERRYISWYGRKDIGSGNLINLTDGGEGNSGRIHSDATKKKQSDAHKGNKNPHFGKTGESCHNYGKKHSTETKQKISASKLGKPRQKCTKRTTRETRPTVECPHCGKYGSKPLMSRWHFNNCRIIPHMVGITSVF